MTLKLICTCVWVEHGTLGSFSFEGGNSVGMPREELLQGLLSRERGWIGMLRSWDMGVWALGKCSTWIGPAFQTVSQLGFPYAWSAALYNIQMDFRLGRKCWALYFHTLWSWCYFTSTLLFISWVYISSDLQKIVGIVTLTTIKIYKICLKLSSFISLPVCVRIEAGMPSSASGLCWNTSINYI